MSASRGDGRSGMTLTHTATVEATHAEELRSRGGDSNSGYWVQQAATQALYQVTQAALDASDTHDFEGAVIAIEISDLTATATLTVPGRGPATP